MSDIKHRYDELPEGGTYIKPFVNTKNSTSMTGGVNFLNKVKVPWDLTVDEMVYCFQGTFRLVVDGESYVCEAGDMMLMPKGMKVSYECDDKCVIFYAVWPVDWKERQGITIPVPGVDPNEPLCE
jgi:ethanolamine utilization protein EutQ